MTVLADAVDFALSVADGKLPEEAVEIGKRALIDYVGVTLAGSTQSVSRIVQSYVGGLATAGEARVCGTSIKASQNMAALANGVAGHALDFDDCSWSTMGHPTVAVAPAAFASGEIVGASGKAVLAAYAVGVEIAHKIAGLVMPRVSEQGWHTTSVFGPFGAAGASAYLMRLREPCFESALGLAASSACGIRGNFGTMAKPYHAGMAACHGVTAAMLAQNGMTAAEDAIEAQDGFGHVFGGRKFEKASIRFGDPWDIIDPGLVFKRYPCCSGAHAAVDCMLEMRSGSPFEPQDVESIRVGVSLLGPRELICHNPQTATEAKFSMEYALAAAILYGRVGLAQFEESCIRDPLIRDLMAKTEMKIDEELAALGFVGHAPAKLRLRLKDGRVLESRCDMARGNPQIPLGDEGLKEKFLECATKVIDHKSAARLLEALFALEKNEDIRSVVKMAEVS
jgi:2-methylcitrate dehydratase PrpD